jgi:uncharacterized protein YdeI (YjbR/CyaY-like superfamily)
MADMIDGLEVLTFGDADAWASWLAEHHDTHRGVWLRIAKKGSAGRTLGVSEALDVALCFGWIDSQRRLADETYFIQKYTPRRPGSSWSKVNVDRVDRLTAAGRMREPGLTQVAAAKADGRWDAAYESQRTATVPPDLQVALADNDAASQAFDSLGRSDRYALILRLLKAKTPADRSAQLRRVIATLEADAGGTELSRLRDPHDSARTSAPAARRDRRPSRHPTSGS